jgi:hypothetical protein
MVRRVLLPLLLLLLPALITAARAQQTQQGTAVMKRWQAMDRCAKQAQATFPDFTAADDAKRNAQLQVCLESQNLPPRTPLAPGH